MKYQIFMFTLTLFLCVSQVGAIGLPRVEIPLSSIIGTTDLIVIGTIISVKENNVSPLRPRSENYEDNLIKGLAIVRIDEVLRGKVAPKEIAINYQIVPPWVAPGASQTRPRVGQKQLFLLQRTADGYHISIETGMRTVESRADVEAAIKAIPLELTIVTPLKPCYFGRQREITVQVRNLTDHALKVLPPYLTGFYYTRGMRNTPLMLQQMTPPLLVPVAMERGEVIMPAAIPPMQPVLEIAAGEEQTISVPFNCQAPAEMAIFGAESYLMAPIAIHASIVVVLATVEKGKSMFNNTQTVNSPWVELYVGYPLEVIAD